MRTVLTLLSLISVIDVAAATLRFDAPAAWASIKPSSSMRLAEFSLPAAAGDGEPASLVVYFFGGQGGSVQANLDRWIGQVTQPDGRASKDIAKTSTLEAHGLKVTLLDISGTYVAEVSPGATERFNKPGFRQIAAVVETPGGPHFIKLVGPQRTITRWSDTFTAFLRSLRYE